MKLGTPVVCVVTKAFAALGQIEAKAWGWDIPLATIKHPLGGVPGPQLSSRAQEVVDFIESEALIEGGDAPSDSPDAAVEPLLFAPADPWDFYDFAQARRWGDGLPVLHPTPDRVARMLARANVRPDLLVGRIPPQRLDVTARDIAANAVLAGCPDAAFPVVLAAIRAALQEKFNLLGVLATTNPAGIGVMVSGYVAGDLGMNSGSSLYGPGNRMNATIGRAVRIACQNLGRAWPGLVDRSTQGQPAKYSLCFAENLEESPWGPYHLERGFKESDSTVTVLAAEGPINMHDPASTDAASFLQYVSGSMAHAGHNNLFRLGDIFLVLCPEHAHMVDRDGYDRARVREYLFENARVPARVLGRECFEYFTHHWPTPEHIEYETALLPLCDQPEQLRIVVAGGPGKHSTWMPTFGITYSAIETIA